MLGETYGIVKVEFSPENSIDGYSALYRFSPTNSDIEFAVIKEYANSITGTSYAAANTFQPSLAPDERNYAVIHWLQLANHNETAAKSFTVNRYDQAGAPIDSRMLTLDPLARFDIQTGHEDLVNGRTNEVSLVEVVPSDPSSPYGGELFRYGGDSNPGFFPSVYSFGLSDNLLNGDSNAKQVFVSTAGAAVPYVEVYNTSNSADVIQVEIKRYDGTSVFSQAVSLAAREQVHIPAASLLGAGTHGIVLASSTNGNNFFAKASHYYYEPSGRISATNTRHGVAALTNVGSSVYNTFLDQFNWLKLFNSDSATQNVLIEAFDLTGNPVGSSNVSIPAGQGIDVELVGLINDSYGQVRVTPSAPNVITADLIKTRPSALDNYTDLVKGLPIR